MKNRTVAFLFFALTISSLVMGFTRTLTDDEKKGLARVQKIEGIEVYVMSEPLREYEVVGDVSVYDTGFGEQYVDDWMNKYVKKAKKLVEDGKQVDAIIYTNGKKATAVKFK